MVISVAPAVLVGVAAGGVASTAAAGVLRSMVYSSRSMTLPFLYAAGWAALALTVTAIGAAWLPAGRAARVDPAVALRAQ